MNLSKEAFAASKQVQPPCCSITAVNFLIGIQKVRNLHGKMTEKASVCHKHGLHRVFPQGMASTEIRCSEYISAHMVQSDE